MPENLLNSKKTSDCIICFSKQHVKYQIESMPLCTQNRLRCLTIRKITGNQIWMPPHCTQNNRKKKCTSIAQVCAFLLCYEIFS